VKALRVLPEVAADVAAAARWYDEEGYLGLGDRFVATFHSCVGHLLEEGEIHRVVYSGFRRVLLRPFPYALYYKYHGELMVVSLVIHGARNPRQTRSVLRTRGV
jgi:ParE toxin of type II toxin-antitoxin system, parDE